MEQVETYYPRFPPLDLRPNVCRSTHPRGRPYNEIWTHVQCSLARKHQGQHYGELGGGYGMYWLPTSEDPI